MIRAGLAFPPTTIRRYQNSAMQVYAVLHNGAQFRMAQNLGQRPKGMRNRVNLCVLLFTSLTLWGQQVSGKKSILDLTRQYLLLATGRTSTLEREIQEAAQAGYRVQVACKPGGYGEWLVLMKKVARPPAIYDYKLIATQLTSKMRWEIEAAADQGYEVVPGTATGGDELLVILERPPRERLPDDEKPVAGPYRFEYQLLATTLTGTLQKELTGAADRGFRAVGLFSRGEHIAILERPRLSVAPEVRQPAAQPRLLATRRTSTMERELRRAVSDGYRVLASSRTSETEMMTVLEKTEQPRQDSTYRVLAANRLSRLQKELNEAGAQGFHLLWRTAIWKRGAGIPGAAEATAPGVPGEFEVRSFEPDQIVGIVEKTPETRGRYRYLVQGAIIPSTIPKKINKAAQEGYSVAALLGRPDAEGSLWQVFAHMVVILEKRDLQ